VDTINLAEHATSLRRVEVNSMKNGWII